MRYVLALLVVGCAGSGGEPTAGATDARGPDATLDSVSDGAGDDTESDTGELIADTAPADVAASCKNGTRDGDETDVDCGGTVCPKCAVGRTCGGATDCASASCGTDGVCGCTALDHCPASTSCVGKLCVAALATCAATKMMYPAATDGEYWVKPSAGPASRAYCDMALGREICTEAGSVVTGTTREGSGTTWSANAKLNHATGLCTLFALKGSLYPFAELQAVAGQTMKTCAAFGFKADGVLGSCAYGTATGRTRCGFAVTTTNRYGNVCTSCTLRPGTFRDYTLQGPIVSSSVLTNAGGTIVTTCRVR